MARSVLIQEYRILGPEVTPYEEFGRQTYRWRWLARLSGLRGLYRTGLGWAIFRYRVEDAA